MPAAVIGRVCARRRRSAAAAAPTRRRRLKLEVFPPDVQLTTSRDRQSFIVVATRADGVTLDVTGDGQGHAGQSGAGADRRPHAVSGGRRRDDAGARLPGPDGQRARDGQGRRGRSADQLQARRDAGLHARRLQHGQLPRRGARQGRLQPVAVRLRSRRRPLPHHARDRLPPHQPGAARAKAC